MRRRLHQPRRRELLPHAVLPDFEIVRCEVEHRYAVAIGHADVDQHPRDRAFDWRGLRRAGLHRTEEGTGEQKHRHGRRCDVSHDGRPPALAQQVYPASGVPLETAELRARAGGDL